jgi:hypothetical protein
MVIIAQGLQALPPSRSLNTVAWARDALLLMRIELQSLRSEGVFSGQAGF